MPMQKIVNGVMVELSPAEEAARLTEESAWNADQSLRDWEEQMRQKDAAITSRMIEDIYDAVVALGGTVPAEINDLMASRKTLRGQRQA